MIVEWESVGNAEYDNMSLPHRTLTVGFNRCVRYHIVTKLTLGHRAKDGSAKRQATSDRASRERHGYSLPGHGRDEDPRQTSADHEWDFSNKRPGKPRLYSLVILVHHHVFLRAQSSPSRMKYVVWAIW